MTVDATQVAATLASRPIDVLSDHPPQASSGWIGYLAWLIWSLVYNVVKLVTITIPTFMFTPFSAKWTLTLHATTLYVVDMFNRRGRISR